MKKNSKKRPPKKLSQKESAKISKKASRFWGLAARLEQRRVGGKKSSK